jgi:hypothetical protein
VSEPKGEPAVKISKIASAKHTLEVSTGELAAMSNLFYSAKQAGVKPTSVQDDIFSEIKRHLGTKIPTRKLKPEPPDVEA